MIKRERRRTEGGRGLVSVLKKESKKLEKSTGKNKTTEPQVKEKVSK